MGGRPTRALPLLRTLLFVPGDRPDRIAKAAASAAAGVAVDLEDAVAVSRKDAARDAAVTALSALPTLVCRCCASESTPWTAVLPRTT